MTTVQQILANKESARMYSISPNQSTFEALELMARHNIGSVIVLDRDAVVGILTEREYARRVALEGKVSRDTPVRDIMETHLLMIEPKMTADDAMALMTEKRMRYLPVVSGKKVIGLISIGDVVKSLIADQKRNIEHLENYISGGEYGVI